MAEASGVGIAGPAALASLGALVVTADVPGFTAAIDSDVAQHVVELILAVLLFVDACEVRGGLFGGEGRALARLVLIALPLSLALVVVTGAWLLPQTGIFVIVVIACIVFVLAMASEPGGFGRASATSLLALAYAVVAGWAFALVFGVPAYLLLKRLRVVSPWPTIATSSTS